MAAFTKQDADDIEELMDAVNSIPAELDDIDRHEMGIGSETAAASSAPEHADQTITRTTVEANGGNSNGR